VAELLAVALGAVIGSFLNVCIVRIPARESIAMPPSHCRVCRMPIRWYDNIPIVSWLALRGRCRSCKAPIPVRYPAVEAITAALALVLVRIGLSLPLLVAAFTAGCVVIVASSIGLDARRAH
jgi:leader peptidase (prepilin peptidase)/N-methyltransferase